jgi:nucleotide-binding universal stress UspA family protein
MSYRSIAVHLDDAPGTTASIDLAFALARRFDAHLVGVAPIGWRDMPAGAAQALGGGNYVQLSVEHLERRALSLRDAFLQRLRAEDGLHGEAHVFSGEATTVVQQVARCCDLLVISQPDHEAGASVPGDFAQRLALQAAVPVLVVPGAGHLAAAGERVLLGWDGSREAARALQAALPFLQRATSVQVVLFDRPQASEPVQPWQLELLRGTLARHGVPAAISREVIDIGVGEALLSRAADLGSDLLVTGAYGHSRMREFILGGATRTLLRGTSLPTLMSH